MFVKQWAIKTTKLNFFSMYFVRINEEIRQKYDILGTKNEKKMKNSALHHKISRVGGGGLLQRLSSKISSNIRYTITQSHCW